MSDTVTFVMSWFILILGLSYLLQQKTWLKLVDGYLNEKNRHAVLPVMMFMFILGLTVILNHNIWEMSMRVTITIFGWAMAIKGALYMIWPQFGEGSIRYFMPIMKPWINIAGAIITVLGAMLVWEYGLNL